MGSMNISPARSDGGGAYLDWNLAARDELEAGEWTILVNLGAALVARWGELPRDLQRRLFETAAAGDGNVREDIARFLHDNAHFLHVRPQASEDLAPGIA